jgi:hypothetical protein
MQRETVFPRMDGDGPKAQLGRGAHHANGDFAAICDQKVFDRTPNGFICE